MEFPGFLDFGVFVGDPTFGVGFDRCLVFVLRVLGIFCVGLGLMFVGFPHCLYAGFPGVFVDCFRVICLVGWNLTILRKFGLISIVFWVFFLDCLVDFWVLV